MQDVFTRAWVNAPGWQARDNGRASYAAWLSRVATNLVIDQSRKVRPVALDGVEEPCRSRAPAGSRHHRAGKGRPHPVRDRRLAGPSAPGAQPDLRCRIVECGRGGRHGDVRRGLRTTSGARTPRAAPFSSRRVFRMNLSIFEDNLDRYGGDFASWPLDLRDAAADFARGSTEAAAALRTMAEVERFLTSSRPSASGPDRLAETASRQPSRPVPRRGMRSAPPGPRRPWSCWCSACSSATSGRPRTMASTC